MSLEYNHLFSQTMLTRAYAYADDNHITNLSIKENHIVAQVKGQSLYDVEINHVEKKVTTCQCSCPYENGYCKHAAAVLLYLDEQQLKYMQKQMKST